MQAPAPVVEKLPAGHGAPLASEDPVGQYRPGTVQAPSHDGETAPVEFPYLLCQGAIHKTARYFE